MNVAVPGGQQVYVASGGALAYTAAHSANIPDDGQTATFSYTPEQDVNYVGFLKFDNKGGFQACPTGEQQHYQVYAWTPKDEAGVFRSDCLGFSFRTNVYKYGLAAYQYD
jgi:hypothetical protein